jgi:predicted PurR-regulated permease PerM
MVFLCIILGGAVLKLTSAVILPFMVALILAAVLYPLVKILDKIPFPRFASIIVAVLVVVALLFIIGVVIFISGRSILANYPRMEDRFMEIYIWTANVFGFDYSKDLSFFENLWGFLGVRTWVRNFTFTFSNFFFRFLGSALLVVIFMGFFLAEASFFKEKIETAYEGRAVRLNRMGQDIMNQVSRYLTAKFFISFGNGIIVAIPLYFIGLEFAIIWGVVQFVLNFIPTFGSIAAGVMVSVFALIQFWPEPVPIILCILVMVGANIITTVVDPKIIGDNVGLSPIVVLISLSVWGYLWGFLGMILSVPMTVTVKIICENIPILEPVSILLGSRKSVRLKKAELQKEPQDDISPIEAEQI